MTWTESAIFTNCLLWVRQNFQMFQLICHSKNSIASQSEWHDIHFILILNEACDFSAVRTQLCSLISSAIWYHSQFDIVSRFDIICSLILLADLIWFAVWYHLQFDIMCDLILSAVWYHSQFDIVSRFDIITDCLLLMSIAQWD